MKSVNGRGITAGAWPLVIVASGIFVASAVSAESAQPSMLRQQMQMMKPELQAKVKALAPETKKLIQEVTSKHTIRSKVTTMRQVMQEVLRSYQGMVTGIVTDNRELAAEAALELANHRIPKGGMLPYLRLEDITDQKIGTLAGFNESVEGSARQLAKAASVGDMTKAASYLTTIATGCVGCHQVFRGVPGLSPWLK